MEEYSEEVLRRGSIDELCIPVSKTTPYSIDNVVTLGSDMPHNTFQQSYTGAKSAWKGYSSQTLYIASRIVNGKSEYEYYPEDIEDLVLRQNGKIVEAVQIKNISSSLTLAGLASSKTSQTGEGFFKRMCDLHAKDPSFCNVKIVYFGDLGEELRKFAENDHKARADIRGKLIKSHMLNPEEADWLLDSISFEKCDEGQLEECIIGQLKSLLPVMAAPELARDHLIQYVSRLSRDSGFITLDLWKEKIHSIGRQIASVDGFYKQYGKALIRFDEMKTEKKTVEMLKDEYCLGVSAHPDHIRAALDFKRPYWMKKIQEAIDSAGVALVKGVSGQGKTTVCYRFLLDAYCESNIFCVRSISSESQALDLVAALKGLDQYISDIIFYIDVKPGETFWAFFIQELQSRGLKIPVLLSIRDEDYNRTPLNGRELQYQIVELTLQREEAKSIFNGFTSDAPHTSYRTFEDAWTAFGGKGPFIEFSYFLSHSERLAERIRNQVNALYQESFSDDGFEVLALVSYAGRLDIPLKFDKVQQLVSGGHFRSAVRRLEDEYLIRCSEEGYIETLHPVRGQMVFDSLQSIDFMDDQKLILQAVSCVPPSRIRNILLDYFSKHVYSIDDIKKLAGVGYESWIGIANSIQVMIWLDARNYIESNSPYLRSLVDKYGPGWIMYVPFDFSGMNAPEKYVIDVFDSQLPFSVSDDYLRAVNDSKVKLTAQSIIYQSLDIFLINCTFPTCNPELDEDYSSLGYTLFWTGKRGIAKELSLDNDLFIEGMAKCDLQYGADAVRGLFEIGNLDLYQATRDVLFNHLIRKMYVVSFGESENIISCKFIPLYLLDNVQQREEKRDNQYWRIKMMHLLEQLYPDKELINIELVGVDLFREIGIGPLDHILNITKDKHPLRWTTVINQWAKNILEYHYRPDSWNEYVKGIDEKRNKILNAVSETIALIDILYKKMGLTGKVIEKVGSVQKLLVSIQRDYKLPKCVVDPYGFFSEKAEEDRYLNIVAASNVAYTSNKIKGAYHESLSVALKKYDNFQKYLEELTNSLANFFNQMNEVLLARCSRAKINKPYLALNNLFNAVKVLPAFQDEYAMLFSNYTTLEKGFDKLETEKYLTLLNMWNYVLELPPGGRSISYTAREKYRKGNDFVSHVINSLKEDPEYEISFGKRAIYFWKDIGSLEQFNEASLYKEFVLLLRQKFKDAISYSSNRWYLEIEDLHFVMIMKIGGVYTPYALGIPLYKLLDWNEEDIAKNILPAEIEQEVLDTRNLNEDQFIWETGLQSIMSIRSIVDSYGQICEKCQKEKFKDVMDDYYNKAEQKIIFLWNDFENCEPIVKTFAGKPPDDSLYMEIANGLKEMVTLMCRLDQLLEILKEKTEINEIIKVLDLIKALMIMSFPFVASIQNNRNDG